MTSTNIYCVYLTIYRGNKMPMFYIGSSNINRINRGYHGSVKSKKYKIIWENELSNNNDLFETKILCCFDTRQKALDKECAIQSQLNVVKSSMYINESLATKNGFFGRDTSGPNHPLWGKKHPRKSNKNSVPTSAITRKRISDSHADVSGKNNPRAKRWKLTSPNSETFIVKGTLEIFCKEHNLGIQLLRKNLGEVIGPRPPGGYHKISKNTIGWKLELL
jgi:hypothetical protein